MACCSPEFEVKAACGGLFIGHQPIPCVTVLCVTGITCIMPRVNMQIYHVGDAELPAKFANLLTAIFQVIFSIL